MKFFLLLALLSQSAWANEKVQGGEEAIPNSIPYQVLLTYPAGVLCGGILLNERTVITAAHCINQYVPDHVIVGDHDRTIEEDTEQKIAIEDLLIHQDYSTSTRRNDVGLLFLASDIDINDYARPIELPEVGSALEPGTEVLLSGWGRLGSSEDSSDVLMQVAVPIVDDEECVEAYSGGGVDVDPEVMVCAGNKGEGACFGDSGGPLAKDNVLVGIVSWGSGDCADRLPAVYARASAFTEFFLENAQ